MQLSDEQFNTICQKMDYKDVRLISSGQVSLPENFRQLFPRMSVLLERGLALDVTGNFAEHVWTRRLFVWQQANGEFLVIEVQPTTKQQENHVPAEITAFWDAAGGLTGNYVGPCCVLSNVSDIFDPRFTGRPLDEDERYCLSASGHGKKHFAMVHIGRYDNGDNLVFDKAQNEIYILSRSEENSSLLTVRSEMCGSNCCYALRFREPLDTPLQCLIESIAETFLSAMKSDAELAEEFAVDRSLERVTNSIGMEFVCLPAGSFVMGSPTNEFQRSYDEEQRLVTISRPFFMGIYEVTNEQVLLWLNDSAVRFDDKWIDVENDVGSGAQERPEHRRPMIMRDGLRFGLRNTANNQSAAVFPINRISWFGATAFCEWLSRREPGIRYRLPTEAEWEYACRAGTETAFWFGDQFTSPERFEWCKLNASRVKMVGLKPCNAWGLHDIAGNAEEWCSDWYEEQPNGSVDPRGPDHGQHPAVEAGGFRVVRGKQRSARRGWIEPQEFYSQVGFRVVRESGSEEQ